MTVAGLSPRFFHGGFMAYRNFIKAFSKISDYFVNHPSVNYDTAKRMANSFFTYANKLRESYVYGTNFNAGDIC